MRSSKFNVDHHVFSATPATRDVHGNGIPMEWNKKSHKSWEWERKWEQRRWE